jgi:hypothetical protein
VKRTDDLAKLREKAAAEQKKKTAADDGLKAEEEKRKKAAEEEKKKAAEKKKKEEAKKASSNAAVEVVESEDMEAEDQDPTAGLEMPKEFLDIQKAMFTPKPFKEEWKAEEAIQEYLPNSAGRSKFVIQKDIDAVDTVLALEDSCLVADFPAYKKQKAALEKELAAVEKHTPTNKVDLASLNLAKEKYAAVEKEKLQRAQMGAGKELDRVRRLKEICSEKMAAWRRSWTRSARSQPSVRQFGTPGTW